MCTTTPFSAARALQRVFIVSPGLKNGLCRHAPPSSLSCLPTVHFSQQRSVHKQRGGPARREVRTEKWNEEIGEAMIQLVDPDTDRLAGAPISRWQALRQLDTKVDRLVQVGTIDATDDGTSTIAVCKVVNIAEALKRLREFKKKQHEIRKVRAVELDVKTLELNWAIDRKDLQHRMSRAKAFLEEGRRVEFVLAPKKKGRKALPEECQELVKTIVKGVEEVDGVRVVKPMEGKLGAVATFLYQGRPMSKRAEQPGATAPATMDTRTQE